MKQLILISFLLSSLVSISQELKISKGKSFPLGYQFSFDRYETLISDGDLHYAYEYHNNKLVAINGSGDLEKELSIDLVNVGSKAQVEKAFALKGNMFLLFSIAASNRKNLVCYELSKEGKLSQEPEASFGNSVNPDIIMEDAPKFSSMKIGGQIELITSEDGSKIGILYLELGKLKEDVKVVAMMLDDKFNKLWSNKVTLPLKYWWVTPIRTAIGSFRIDNFGNACGIITSAKADYYNVRSIHALVINSKGLVFKNALPISTSRNVLSADADFDNSGNVFIAASLTTVEKGEAYGLKTVKFSSDSGKAIFTADIPYSKVKADFDKKHTFYEFDYYLITGINLTSKGDIYILQEQLRSSTGGVGSTQSSYLTLVADERMNLMYHHLNAGGTLIQTTPVEKHQMGERANMSSLNDDGSCNYVYHYSGTNNSRKFDTESGFYAVKIDTSGSSEKKLIEKADGEGFCEGVVRINKDAYLFNFSNNSKKGKFYIITN